MNKKTGIILFILIAVAAVCLVTFRGRKPGPERTSFKIGAILPLTGDAAQYGNNDREGIVLAVDQANAQGGINGRKIEVAFEDCQTDAKKAVSAFNKLRTANVEVVIDDAISTISLALTPLLEQNKTVLISTGASNPSLSGMSPYFFRIWNSDAFEGVVTSDYLKTKHRGAKIAIFYINSDYGKGLHDVVSKALKGSDIQVVASESFEKDARDFRSQVAKVKDVSPTHVYLVGYAAQTGPAAKQLREGGVSAPLIGTVAMEDPEFIKLAGEAAEGVVYPFPVAPSGTVVDEFKTAFKKACGKEPGLLHDCGFDAANLILKAVRDGATSGEQVRAKLAETRDFQGASGLISFDDKGDVHKPMQMKVIKNGAFTTLP
jgi:branched-chain amino acid transport system substrate-binding protein